MSKQEAEKALKNIAFCSGFLIFSAPAIADAPIQAVTLFESGLAEITRVTQPEPAAADGTTGEIFDPLITLALPRTQVDDFLQSVRISGAVTSARIMVDGATPVEDAFARDQLGLGDLEGLAALLGASRGVHVVMEGPNGVPYFEGRVMGVTRPTCGDDRNCLPELLLRTEDGLVTVDLNTHRRAILSDHNLLQRIDNTLDALTPSAGRATHGIHIVTESEGPVSLSYVIPAPLWRAAYRVTEGENGSTHFEAWAILENLTGEDWNGVRLTLSSGGTNALEVDLTSRTWGGRGRHAAQHDLEREATQFVEGGRLMELDAPGIAHLELRTGGVERGLDTRFTFPEPLYLDQGQIISLPFQPDAVPADQTLIWRGEMSDRNGNPDFVLRVENPLPIRLPAGIMTVYDQTGYLGDAAFPDLLPGATADVLLGIDHRVVVTETVSEQSTERRVSVSQGTVQISERWVHTTEYHVRTTSGDIPALTIIHPNRPNWEITETSLVPDQNAGTPQVSDADLYRLELPAGTETLQIHEEWPRIEVLQISDLTHERLFSLMADRVSRDDRTRLAQILAAMQQRDRLQEELNQLADERERAVADQERARRMMNSAPSGSDMEERFRNSALELEDQIQDADSRQARLITEYRAADAELDALLSE